MSESEETKRNPANNSWLFETRRVLNRPDLYVPAVRHLCGFILLNDNRTKKTRDCRWEVFKYSRLEADAFSPKLERLSDREFKIVSDIAARIHSRNGLIDKINEAINRIFKEELKKLQDRGW